MRSVSLLNVPRARLDPVVRKIFILGPEAVLLQREVARLALFVVLECVEQRRARDEPRCLALAHDACEVMLLTALAAERQREQHAGDRATVSFGIDLALHR